MTSWHLVYVRTLWLALLLWLPGCGAGASVVFDAGTMASPAWTATDARADKYEAITSGELPPGALKHHYAQWLEQLRRAVPEGYNGLLVPVLDTAHSRFPYWFINTDLVFNQYTYEYISARVMPGPVVGTVQLSDGHGFTNAYIQLMNSIAYRLGPAEREALAVLASVMRRQSGELLSSYEKIYGTITSKQIEGAEKTVAGYGGPPIVTKLDYAILYVMGYIWSGRDDRQEPPLTFIEIAGAASLQRLFVNMPASGAQLLSQLGAYLESYRLVQVPNSSAQYNSRALAQSSYNAQNPDEANGGIRTFDPSSGAISEAYEVGYGVGISLAQIRNALNDDKRVIHLSFRFSGTPPQSAKRNRQLLPLDALVQFTAQSGEADGLDALRMSGEGTLSLTYRGFVYVPFTRTDWRPGGSGGWYFSDPIAQAAAGRPQSGYCFVLEPPYDLGDLDHGGDFGALTGLLIANSPMVTITWGGLDGSQIEVIEQAAAGDRPLQLSAMVPSGRASQSAYRCTFRRQGSDAASLTFTPASPNPVTVPDALQMADVLLASVVFPGAG